jgi:hypothetical protein
MSPVRLVLLATLAALATPARAQTDTTTAPTRDADVWDGHSHPAAGMLAAPPAVRRREDRDVERLRSGVLRRAEQGANDPVSRGTQPSQ